MYGIFTYFWLKGMVNVGKYSIHGSYGIYNSQCNGVVMIDHSTLTMGPRHWRTPAIGGPN